MKIAFFTETFLPKVDGIVTRLTTTVKHLVDAGAEVVVFCPEGCPDEYMGARLLGVPALPLPLSPEPPLALPRPAGSSPLTPFHYFPAHFPPIHYKQYLSHRHRRRTTSCSQ